MNWFGSHSRTPTQSHTEDNTHTPSLAESSARPVSSSAPSSPSLTRTHQQDLVITPAWLCRTLNLDSEIADPFYNLLLADGTGNQVTADCLRAQLQLILESQSPSENPKLAFLEKSPQDSLQLAISLTKLWFRAYKERLSIDENKTFEPEMNEAVSLLKTLRAQGSTNSMFAIFDQLPYLFDPLWSFWAESLGSIVSSHPSFSGLGSHIDIQNYLRLPSKKLDSSLLTISDLWKLCHSLPFKTVGVLSGIPSEWQRLYNSDIHGLSLNRFEAYTYKYPDPTLVVIQGADKKSGDAVVFGIYIPVPWKHSRHAWGDADSQDSSSKFVSSIRLFQLYPSFHVYQCLIPTRAVTTSGSFVGIGLLQDGKSFRLKTDFLEGEYQSGSIFDTVQPFSADVGGDQQVQKEVKFAVDTVETFGFGSHKSKTMQEAEWKLDAKEAERRTHVNVNSLGADRMILEMGGAHTFSEEFTSHGHPSDSH